MLGAGYIIAAKMADTVISILKGDDSIRQIVTKWIKSTDSMALVKAWVNEYWLDPGGFPVYNYALLKLPDGYNWSVISRSRYMMDLKYFDFSDQEHILKLELKVSMSEAEWYIDTINMT